jgi:ribosomal-protein-alanine acetyltransferase
VEIRELTLADLPEVMNLERELFGSEAWLESSMASELQNPNTYYIGLFENSLLGYAGLSAIPASFSADVQTIGVAPKHQGKGLGRKLMDLLMARALAVGAEQVLLEVRADNETAISLYRSMDFEQIDLRKRYYQPSGVDALIMRTKIKQPIVLGIESTCDETGVGIVQGNRLLANALGQLNG